MIRTRRNDGVIIRTCAMLGSLVRGAVHDRRTLADAFDIELAAADRYIRALSRVPGVLAIKSGRRLTLRWSFTDAIREAGL